MLVGMTNAPRPEAAALHRAQLATWDHLLDALHRARNGYWSMGVESEVDLLVEIIRASKPIPWGSIPVVLLLSGVYTSVLEKAGLDGAEHVTPEAREAAQLLATTQGIVVPEDWAQTCEEIASMELGDYDPDDV